ncbi:MAG: SIMPL domain-containing protein [Actinobacteria bacterium]|nr:SIMPL domain-containing protein [Cyanobacteriota bacterium]MCL5772140.1 SIMPL domain-containing protein [Actinomycetota bacterium]
MKKIKKINLLLLSISILIILFSFIIMLPGCIGQKPPRYVNEPSSTKAITEETIYGSQDETQKLSAINQAKTIAVSSEGVVKVVPDIVKVRIEISTEKPSSEEAVNTNSIDTQNVITAIKTTGESDLKIETSGYSLQPLYNYVTNKPPQIYAYNATTTLLVTTKKLEKIGSVISTAVEAGASDISSISYDLSDEVKKSAKNEALAIAVKDANNKADAIAKAMAADIVDVYSVNETGMSYPSPVIYESMKREQAVSEANAVPPVILPQELEVKAEISVIYIFK